MKICNPEVNKVIAAVLEPSSKPKQEMFETPIFSLLADVLPYWREMGMQNPKDIGFLFFNEVGIHYFKGSFKSFYDHLRQPINGQSL